MKELSLVPATGRHQQMLFKNSPLCLTHASTPKCAHGHTHTLTYTCTHSHTSRKRIEKFILTAGTGIDVREGALLCSGNYLDKSLRIWINGSQGNKKVAKRLCIKIETKFMSSGKQKSPAAWCGRYTASRRSGQHNFKEKVCQISNMKLFALLRYKTSLS